jgi:hypothetical protein
MGINVSSWFIDQLFSKTSSPKRVFYMNGSDHTDRVNEWPLIRRSSTKIKPVVPSVDLVNIDGLYNEFYSQLYTLNASCQIKFGFTHPTSGDELISIYSGFAKKVDFDNIRTVKVTMHDKMKLLTKRIVGDSENNASFSEMIPSDIAYTLCSCYGGLDTAQNSLNRDINWEYFEAWSNSFSADSVICSANYDGIKVTEALDHLVRYTDSLIWEDGNGKICFSRFTENSSDDFLLLEGQYKDITLEVKADDIITKALVQFDYNVSSSDWGGVTYSVNTEGQNSFGLFEEIYKFDDIWYTTSVQALNLATRVTERFAVPQRSFSITVPFFGIHRIPGDTIRFINSFWNVNSALGFRLDGEDIDLRNRGMNVKYTTMVGYISTAFYLDKDYLDSSSRFLL